jgi:hypothetical protein
MINSINMYITNQNDWNTEKNTIKYTLQQNHYKINESVKQKLCSITKKPTSYRRKHPNQKNWILARVLASLGFLPYPFNDPIVVVTILMPSVQR